MSFSTWEAGDGRRFTVNVSDSPDITLDDLAWWNPGGRATTVRGRTGIYAERHQAALVWMERPGDGGVAVLRHGHVEQELMAIAEGLRPVEAGAWRKLVARAPQPSPRIRLPNGPGSADPVGQGTPKPLNANNSYFLIRPEQGRAEPPCLVTVTGPTAPVVVERRDGQETACYQVGLPESPPTTSPWPPPSRTGIADVGMSTSPSRPTARHV